MIVVFPSHILESKDGTARWRYHIDLFSALIIPYPQNQSLSRGGRRGYKAFIVNAQDMLRFTFKHIFIYWVYDSLYVVLSHSTLSFLSSDALSHIRSETNVICNNNLVTQHTIKNVPVSCILADIRQFLGSGHTYLVWLGYIITCDLLLC